jgi:long-subunit fatty acid transport protein
MLLLAHAAHAGSISAPAVIAGPDAGPATTDPAAVFYNPAAIAPLRGFHFLFDTQVSFVHVEATTTRNGGLDPNTCSDYTDTSTCLGYATAVADVPVPVFFLGATYQPWKDRLTVGVAATDNYVGGGVYQRQGFEPTDDQPTDDAVWTRYQGISTQIVTVGVTPALAFTVVKGLHIGGGATYTLDMIDARQASDALGNEGAPIRGVGEPYGNDIILSADGKGSHWVWNAGIFFDKWKKAQVGLSYTAAGTFSAEGEATLEVPGGVVAAEDVEIPGSVAVEMNLPAVIRGGITSQLNERLTVGGSVEYYLWNDCCGTHDGDIRIDLVSQDGDEIGADAEDGLTTGITVPKTTYNPRRLWNSLNIGVSGGYQALPKLWLGARVGWDQYAVPDWAISPTNLDFDAYGLQGAVRWRVARPVTLGLSYTHFFLDSVTVKHSAWGASEDSADYRDEYFTTALPYQHSTNGFYSGHVNTVGVRVAVDLGPKMLD